MRRNRLLNLGFIIIFICLLSFFACRTDASTFDEAAEEILYCKVRFDSNGGSIKWYSKDVKIGTIYGGLPVAKRNAHKFIGWYRNKTRINTSTVLRTNRDHVLSAKWLGTPSLTWSREGDFVKITCRRLGDASGVYLYVNGIRHDSAKKTAPGSKLVWNVSKNDESYTFTVNLNENIRYSCYAEAYYESAGNVITGSKSERIPIDNSRIEYKSFDMEEMGEVHGMPMTNYYSTGKNRMNRWATGNLTPQGICSTPKYILITGYGPKEAKITVLDRKTQNGLVVLGLNDKLLELDLGGKELLGHVGGIAYDEQKNAIWVSGISKRNIIRIDLKTIDKYVNMASRFLNVFELQKEKDFTIYKTAYMGESGKAKYATPSFLEYEDGYLYIGTFSQNNIGYLRKFKLCTKNCLELIEEMRIPNKIQGAVFTDNGELILSQSYGRKNPSRFYVYKGHEKQLSTYQLSHVVENLPPMSEEIMIYKGKLHILFESSARRYRRDCPNVQEHIWTLEVNAFTEKQFITEENIY